MLKNMLPTVVLVHKDKQYRLHLMLSGRGDSGLTVAFSGVSPIDLNGV